MEKVARKLAEFSFVLIYTVYEEFAHMFSYWILIIIAGISSIFQLDKVMRTEIQLFIWSHLEVRTQTQVFCL